MGDVIRVVLAADHLVVRAGLKVVMKSAPDIEVVAEAKNGHEAVEITERLHEEHRRPGAGGCGPAGGVWGCPTAHRQGYSASEVGEQLCISPKTVDTYKQRIQEKLGLSHRAEYVQFALKLGLLSST